MPNKPQLLLDSHVFVWALEQVHKIGPLTLALIQSGQEVFVSKASLWELAIKYKAQKFPYDTNYLLEGIHLSGFTVLDIQSEHLQTYSSVRLPHKDPFDSLLIAQAQAEQLLFVTADDQILQSAYNLQDAAA